MVKLSRWLDHLPPWISFGALASTGVFEPGEVVLMALPLVAAAGVEALRLDLSRFRRLLEFGVLGFLVLEALRQPGVVPLTVHTLFFLCGARLALPRELPQRRQLLLMAFLLLLVTSVSTADLGFLGWALAWMLVAAAHLLQQAWETSAQVHRGPASRPPFAKVLVWGLGALVLGGCFFVALPRITLGLRPFRWRPGNLGGAHAGFSDHLDLEGGGPISGNPEVVARVVPPKALSRAQVARLGQSLALLRGLSLDAYDGRTWEYQVGTGLQRVLRFAPPFPPGDEPAWAATDLIRLYLAPLPRSVVPLPYGDLEVIPPWGTALRTEGGRSAAQWGLASGSRAPLGLVLRSPEPALRAGLPEGRWRALLTDTAGQQALVRRWADQLAPGETRPGPLARQLVAGLRAGYRYDLANPSGGAGNPLEDFLERSRAGHCEYFASALALMLRARDVPARVVNGFRLGPWIPEGGYWLVTQNEAHSWVEYWDDHRWQVADPTPPAPPTPLEAPTWTSRLTRWKDTLAFAWDRNVVRFSDQDQQAGLGWLQAKAAAVKPPSLPHLARDLAQGRNLAYPAAALLLAVLLWRRRDWLCQRLPGPRSQPGAIRALRPLLRRAGPHLQPRPGETAHAWLRRLAASHPQRRGTLLALADLADAAAYGTAPEAPLRAAAREEARRWKR